MNQADGSLGRFPKRSLAAGLLCVLAAAGAAAGAGAADEAKLSPQKYSDKLNGFWLRPPTECEQVKDPASSCLVRWIARDANTGLTHWTLGVNVAIEKDANLDLRKYSLALAGLLKTQEGQDISSNELTHVDGKGAIDLQGTSTGDVKVWRRQVWVLAQPGRFLIFWVSGAPQAKERLTKLLDAVLATVGTIDPLEVLKAQQASLLRGRTFLAELRSRALVPAPGIQWFLFLQDGNAVGWTLQTESLAQRDQRKGLEIQTLTLLKLPKDQMRLAKRVLFTTPTGAEQWKETLQVGEGERKTLTQEEGLRQEDLVLCTVSFDNRLQTNKKQVPFDANEPREMYLPRALGLILPRLLDLTRPASYAFATYSTQENKFKLRTFTVIGPEKIMVGSRQVDAVHLTDVEEANEEVATDLWVDAKGVPLRIQAPGWPVIQVSSREEILARLPESQKTIEAAVGK
jgi:hypothetical protein